jgi:hypothetical protein
MAITARLLTLPQEVRLYGGGVALTNLAAWMSGFAYIDSETYRGVMDSLDAALVATR